MSNAKLNGRIIDIGCRSFDRRYARPSCNRTDVRGVRPSVQVLLDGSTRRPLFTCFSLARFSSERKPCDEFDAILPRVRVSSHTNPCSSRLPWSLCTPDVPVVLQHGLRHQNEMLPCSWRTCLIRCCDCASLVSRRIERYRHSRGLRRTNRALGLLHVDDTCRVDRRTTRSMVVVEENTQEETVETRRDRGEGNRSCTHVLGWTWYESRNQGKRRGGESTEPPKGTKRTMQRASTQAIQGRYGHDITVRHVKPSSAHQSEKSPWSSWCSTKKKGLEMDKDA